MHDWMKSPDPKGSGIVFDHYNVRKDSRRSTELFQLSILLNMI